jgi:cell division protein FtsL
MAFAGVPFPGRSFPVQGVYSPVAAAPGAKRSSAAWMGTPEIFFAKSIDNSRLVKVTDHQRTREMASFTVSVCCFFVLVMVYAFQHFSAIEYGYKIEAQKKQREELVEANRALRLEEASLRDPERIDVLARQMGLNSPEAGQVIRLERSTDQRTGAVAMMASQVRVSDVAVITAH